MNIIQIGIILKETIMLALLSSPCWFGSSIALSIITGLDEGSQISELVTRHVCVVSLPPVLSMAPSTELGRQDIPRA